MTRKVNIGGMGHKGAGEMVWRLKTLTDLAEEPGFNSQHPRWGLTGICDPSSGGTDVERDRHQALS